VKVEEPPLLEELVDGGRQTVPYPRHGPDRVRPGAEMCDLAEELHGMALLLEGVGLGLLHVAQNRDRRGEHLDGLAFALRFAQLAFDPDRAAGNQVQDLALIVGQ